MLFEYATTTAGPGPKKVKRKVNRTVYELLKPGAWLEPYLPDNYIKAYKLFRGRRVLVRYVTAGDFRRLECDGVLRPHPGGGFQLARKAILALRGNNAIKRTYQVFMEDQRQARRLARCICLELRPVHCHIAKPRIK